MRGAISGNVGEGGGECAIIWGRDCNDDFLVVVLTGSRVLHFGGGLWRMYIGE
jgi:hypothetical protein